MATATLTPVSHDSPPTSLAKWFLPWLLSTASHLALILVLALFVEKQRGAGNYQGAEPGMLLTSVQLSPRGDAGGSSVEVTRYYADDDSNVVQASSSQNGTTEPNDRAIKLHTKGELAALFDDAPPVDLESLLSSSSQTTSSKPAAGNNEVPDATEMIRGGSAGRGNGSGAGVGDGAGPVGLGEALAKGAAHTGVFGVSGVGYKFVYVFDRSGSMDGHGGAPLAAAKSELVHSLHELDKTHQFQVIFYNKHPRVFTLSGNDARLAFGTEQNKRLAERFIGGITADGATQHEEALVLALRLDPDVIFFLTDADEPTLSAKQLARIAQLNNGTTINAIEFGYGPQADSDNFLVKLARQNGGQHGYVDVSQLPRP